MAKPTSGAECGVYWVDIYLRRYPLGFFRFQFEDRLLDCMHGLTAIGLGMPPVAARAAAAACNSKEAQSTIGISSRAMGFCHRRKSSSMKQNRLYRSRPGSLRPLPEIQDRDLTAEVMVDANACKGMLLGTGVGKAKHLSTTQ